MRSSLPFFVPEQQTYHPTHHAEQPPSRIARLSSDTDPVLRAVDIEFDVLELACVFATIGWSFRDGVVCAEDLEGFAITGGSVFAGFR